jgi:hypothetical protein
LFNKSRYTSCSGFFVRVSLVVGALLVMMPLGCEDRAKAPPTQTFDTSQQLPDLTIEATTEMFDTSQQLPDLTIEATTKT